MAGKAGDNRFCTCCACAPSDFGEVGKKRKRFTTQAEAWKAFSRVPADGENKSVTVAVAGGIVAPPMTLLPAENAHQDGLHLHIRGTSTLFERHFAALDAEGLAPLFEKNGRLFGITTSVALSSGPFGEKKGSVKLRGETLSTTADKMAAALAECIADLKDSDPDQAAFLYTMQAEWSSPRPPTPQTLHLQPYTLNPKPQTLNPKPTP